MGKIFVVILKLLLQLLNDKTNKIIWLLVFFLWKVIYEIPIAM